MATEDFTTYTEADPNSRITVTTRRITSTDMLAGDNQHYVYLDKGAAFFSGDFTHLLTVKVTASDQGGASNHLWAMTNDIDDFIGLVGGSKDFLTLQARHPQSPNETQLRLIEGDGGTEYFSSTYAITEGTIYYLKLVRDESIGTYGRISCFIYSNPARTPPLFTLFINLHSSKKDFRYVFGVMSEDATSGTTKKISGYSEDLIISADGTDDPTVTTQAITKQSSTAAIGEGNITSLGSSAVTAHGHVWSTSPSPDLGDDSADNGVAYQTGSFETFITGLSPGDTYYFRAFATNSSGTSYGSDVTITLDSTVQRRFLWTETQSLHYFDAYGAERKLEGVGVTSDKDILSWMY